MTGGRMFFLVKPDTPDLLADHYEWVNRETFRKNIDSRKPFMGIDLSASVPVISFKRPASRLLDAYSTYFYCWLISEKAKNALEDVDAHGFAFYPVQIEPESSSMPSYYLCDMVRLLDCVDELKSTIRYQQDSPFKNYLGLKQVVFLEERVGRAHAFRLFYAPTRRIADDVLRKRIDELKITGFDWESLTPEFN